METQVLQITHGQSPRNRPLAKLHCELNFAVSATNEILFKDLRVRRRLQAAPSIFADSIFQLGHKFITLFHLNATSTHVCGFAPSKPAAIRRNPLSVSE
jgi:hypothetical protein